jgi:hypothetical protein
LSLEHIPTALPKRITAFLGDWVTSTTILLFTPRNALVGSRKSRPAALTDTKKSLAFAGSSIVISLVTFSLVNSRQRVHWAFISEGVSFALLLTLNCCAYSMLVAGVLKLLGGAVDPQRNIISCIKALATFYLISTFLATLLFLVSFNDLIMVYNDRILYDATLLMSKFVLSIIYLPLIFSSANRLSVLRTFVFSVAIIFFSAVGFLVSAQMMSSNPGLPGVAE